MSQHLYPATHQGTPVSVLIGYDRPLKGFFMVIERPTTLPFEDLPPDADEDEEDPYLYSNLADMELVPWGGLPPTLDHFLTKLQELDIPALPNVIAEVRADQANNTGNRTVRYDAAGAVLAKA
jgi:hypothetical protein